MTDGLLFYIEDAGSTFLRNIDDNLPYLSRLIPQNGNLLKELQMSRFGSCRLLIPVLQNGCPLDVTYSAVSRREIGNLVALRRLEEMA
jgi:hypothetical protein